MTVGTGVLDLADGRRGADARTESAGDGGAGDGTVVLHCHGVPGSRWELGLVEASLLPVGPGVQFLSLSRPGYGPSDFRTLSGFVEWTTDVEEVLDRLDIDRVAVVGASGGAPFALACARRFPDRVSRVAVVVGVGPPRIPGMERSAAVTDEPPLGAARRTKYWLVSLAFAVGLGPRLARRIISNLGPEDRHVLTDPAMRQAYLQVADEAFSQWGRGAAQDGGLLLQPWDFELPAITQPVRLWYGERDTQVPVQVGQSLHALLPTSSLVTWSEHGHFSWVGDGNAVADIASFVAGRG